MQLQELFGSRDFDDSKLDISTNARRWEANYETPGGDNIMVKGVCYNIKDTWNLSFSVNGEYGQTDKGKQFDVFQIVIELLRKFVDAKKPKALGLSAAGDSRIALYKRMLKRLLPDWKMVVHDYGGRALIFTSPNGEIPVEFDDDSVIIDMGEVAFNVYFHEPSRQISFTTGIIKPGLFLAPEIMNACSKAIGMAYDKLGGKECILQLPGGARDNSDKFIDELKYDFTLAETMDEYYYTISRD